MAPLRNSTCDAHVLVGFIVRVPVKDAVMLCIGSVFSGLVISLRSWYAKTLVTSNIPTMYCGLHLCD